LHAEGLPPGVNTQPTTIAAGANEGFVLLSSCEKPERWIGAIRILGKAKIGDSELVREARGGAVSWPVADASAEAVRPRLTRDIALAVSAAESAPGQRHRGGREALGNCGRRQNRDPAED
jgi:hypothetical protein